MPAPKEPFNGQKEATKEQFFQNVQRDGNTLYVLNDRGENLWHLQVSPGQTSAGTRLPEVDRENIAGHIYQLLTAPDPKEELIAELVKELESIHDWNRIERAPLRVQEIQSIERLLAKAHSLTKKHQ